MQSSTLRFAAAVQALARTVRAMGLTMPGFRSPPRLSGVQRSIKRWPGGATVSVVVRGRPWAAVQADLIEGIVAANELDGPAADRARAELWLALEGRPEPTRRPVRNALRRSAAPAAPAPEDVRPEAA